MIMTHFRDQQIWCFGN